MPFISAHTANIQIRRNQSIQQGIGVKMILFSGQHVFADSIIPSYNNAQAEFRRLTNSLYDKLLFRLGLHARSEYEEALGRVLLIVVSTIAQRTGLMRRVFVEEVLSKEGMTTKFVRSQSALTFLIDFRLKARLSSKVKYSFYHFLEEWIKIRGRASYLIPNTKGTKPMNLQEFVNRSDFILATEFDDNMRKRGWEI